MTVLHDHLIITLFLIFSSFPDVFPASILILLLCKICLSIRNSNFTAVVLQVLPHGLLLKEALS